MKRILFLSIMLIGLSGIVTAQNVFDPNDPIVRYSSSAAYGTTQKPDSNKAGLQKWVSVSTSGISSGSGSFATQAATYKSYYINFYGARLPFRLKFPKSFTNPDSANKKYPVALFMHGAGEGGCASNGGIYNNEKQLLHGGKLFAQRVDNNEYDGFLLYPQIRSEDGSCSGVWRSGPNLWYNAIVTVLDSMQKYVRADMDRVFVFGLSGGGIATWELIENYPTRFASAAPTSAAGIPMTWNALIHIPVWLATGGKDGNPSPVMAEYTETNIKDLGGNIRRDLYPDLGHAAWDRHWAQTDFVPFMNAAHKANPLIFFNRFDFCPDAMVSAKIGITAGFYDYEWRRGNETIATSYGVGNPNNNNRTNTIVRSQYVASMGSGGNEITVRDFGTYYVRFRRVPGGPWSEWSPKPAQIVEKALTQTPLPQIVGVNSKVLPSLDGKTKVQLELPEGFQNYQWVRTSDNVTVATTRLFDAPAGTYKARYSEPYGCGTLYSPNFTVVNASGSPKPDEAKNLSVTPLSQTSLRLDWNENASAGTNETGFEIYRASKAGGPYTLIHVTGPDVVNYQDNNLSPNTTYYYVVRAVGEFGAANASNEASGKTDIDVVPPTPPSGLEYRGSTSTSVSLRWKAATDDAAVARYDIYANDQKLYSTTNTYFTVANLDSLTTYTFYVRAVDKAGNASEKSNQVVGYTHRQGLNYKYITGSFGNNIPNFNNYTAVKSGITDTVNAGIGLRTQEDNYAILWQGNIYIPVDGTYTFETESDDGSKLYIDMAYSHSGTALVNNDGAHGAQVKVGSKFLTAGYHQIAITYSEIGGDETMNLYWSNNVGLARERIPKNFFSIGGETYSPTTVAAPSKLVATPLAYNKIQLTWQDNSNNETGFEITRSTSLNGTYVPIVTTGANVTSFTDSGLTAATKYFYKIRAVTAGGASEFVNTIPNANWRLNNNLSEANGGTSLGSSSSIGYNSSDKVEGSHAVSLTSSTSYLSMGSTNTFPALGGYNQRTIAFWMKPSATSSKRMIFEIGNSTNGIGLRINSNALQAGIKATGSNTLFSASVSNFTSNSNWLSGQWNHVAVVYNQTKFSLYLNGVEVASVNNLPFAQMSNSGNASRFGQPSSTTSSHNVFNDNGYTAYSGLFDNIYIADMALSTQEIVDLKNNDWFPASYATTLPAPAAPPVPNGVAATVLSTKAIRIVFNDNSTSEKEFEIWRASGDKSNNRKIATLPAGDGGQQEYIDSSLFANTTYYYRVRAIGETSNSAFSTEVSGKTLNSKPVITRCKDFTMLYGTTFVLPVTATDADGEVLTFTTVNLPSFATVQDVANGRLNITFNPSTRQRGTYTMSVIVHDASGGKDTTRFNLVVNNNDVPVMSAIQESVTVKEGDQVTIPVSATDGNGVSGLTWTLSEAPDFVTFTNNNNGTGTINIKPGYAASGNYTFTIAVSDALSAWTSKTVTVSVTDREPDETVQFDFRSTSPILPDWTPVNVVSPGFSHGPVYSLKGNLTDIALTLMKGTVAFTTNGPSTGETGAFPDAVIKDNMTWGFNTTNNLNDTIIIRVSGLNPYNTYNFTFHGHNYANVFVQYIIGAQSIAYNAFNNLSSYTISNVQPDADGNVFITLIGDPATSRGGVLSGLVIKSNFNDGTKPAKPLSLSGQHTTGIGVQLQWDDKAYNEEAYRVYRSTSRTGAYTLLNPGATNRDSSSFIDASVAPHTKYFYYVVGVNVVGTGIPSDTIEVMTANNAPAINIGSDIYAKTGVLNNANFTVTDDAVDVVTVTIEGHPSFVSLVHLGGSNYRIVTNANNDHIGWYSFVLKAVDDKGGESSKTVRLTVSDKNTRSIYINFGSVGKTAPAPWNNWLGNISNGSSLSGLKDEQNATTSIQITSTSTWGLGVFNLGHITGNNSGVVPDSVLASGIVDQAAAKTFTISGLNNSKRYNIVFVASRNEGKNNSVEYSSGSVLDTLNAKYNYSLTANVNGLTPSGGQLTVSLRRLQPSDVNFLNAIIIEEYDPSITILNPLNLRAEPIDRNTIDLTWSDRTREEAAIAGYVLERATDSLFTMNLTSFNINGNNSYFRNTGLNPNTKYWYRLRAKTGGGIFSEYSNRAKAITPASIVYIDFNYTLPEAPYPWNTFEASSIAGVVLEDMITSTGAPSGMSLEMTRVFNGEFTLGVNTTNNSGVVPDRALASNYWIDNTQLAGFRLSGLNHSRKYRIGFFGSSAPWWAEGDYTATYTINGRTVYLNSWMNSSKVVYIDDVVPDASGGVDLDFSTTEDAVYGFNSGIIVMDYTDPDNPNSESDVHNLVLLDDASGAEALAYRAADAAANADSAAVNGRVYPNPFHDFVNIDFVNTSAANNISVEVYDISGRMGYRKVFGKLPQGSNTVRIGAADAGMKMGVYVITLSANGKPVQTHKVIRTIN